MLKVNNGEVVIHGKKLDLMAEYTQLTHQLMQCEVFNASEIDMCVQLAKKPRAEVEAEAKEKEEVWNFMKELFDDLK